MKYLNNCHKCGSEAKFIHFPYEDMVMCKNEKCGHNVIDKNHRSVQQKWNKLNDDK